MDPKDFLPQTLGEVVAERERVEREIARRQRDSLPKSLRAYVKAAWPIILPGRPLHWHWGLDAVCEHLEAVTMGQIDQLIINIPPGMLKSTLVAVLWPTWEWTFRPMLRWLFATYSRALTFRDAGYRRTIIQSKWYRERWRFVFDLVKDGDEFIQNNYMGHMFSTSTGAASTGWRGDRLVLDDPQDPRGAESELKREDTIEWLNRTWPTRRDAGPHSAEVLIQQRLHEMDATGLYLSQGTGWVHLKIPLEWKGQHNPTRIGYRDPRETKGEVISKEVYPPDKVERDKRKLGPYGVAGQFDQEPAPAEGGIIKTAWFRTYPGTTPGMDDEIELVDPRGHVYRVKPRNNIRFCIVDPATTEAQTIKKGKQNDPDWFVLGAFLAFATSPDPKDPQPIIAMLDLDMGKWEAQDHEPKIQGFHEKWDFTFICVETFGFQLSLFQKLKALGLPVRKLSNADPEGDDDAIVRIDGDKAARAYNAVPLMADARFYVPTFHPWLGEYINQNTRFPNAAHDDCMDVTSGAVAVAENIRYSVNLEQLQAQEPKPASVDLPPPADDTRKSVYEAMRPSAPWKWKR